MNEERDWIRWTERGLFLVGLLLLIQPVVSSKFFFTVDGPAHVYNASLLLDLFNSSAEERGWEVNRYPYPTGPDIFCWPYYRSSCTRRRPSRWST